MMVPQRTVPVMREWIGQTRGAWDSRELSNQYR
jgi:hypothetical protein